jgi:ferrochelatase
VSEAGASAVAAAQRQTAGSEAPSEQSCTVSEAGASEIDAAAHKALWRYDAVLLAGFGGPEGPDDVVPFLRNVTRGRGVPDERLAEVAQHYLALGGSSPINSQNRALQSAIAAELELRGIDIPVLWGNRNWHPYFGDVVRDAGNSWLTRLLAVATSAYSSYSSCRQYRENFARALEESGMLGRVVIDKVRPFCDTPGFLAPFVDGVVKATNDAEAQGFSLDEITAVFTTHSIPLTMSERSGTVQDGSLYVAQHLAACAAVVDEVRRRIGGTLRWQLAYQSRSGPPTVPWLEPDINTVIGDLASNGCRGVVVVPIGFVSDHVEVTWDLDTEAAQTASRHGLWFTRVPTPGTDPRFVAALVDLIAARLDPALPPVGSATSLPVRPDVCPAQCCRGTTVRPTTAGADSAADWVADDGIAAADAAALAGSGVGATGG